MVFSIFPFHLQTTKFVDAELTLQSVKKKKNKLLVQSPSLNHVKIHKNYLIKKLKQSHYIAITYKIYN